MKNDWNVMNFVYSFVRKFEITFKIFPGDWTDSFTVIFDFFFENDILKNSRKL